MAKTSQYEVTIKMFTNNTKMNDMDNMVDYY